MTSITPPPDDVGTQGLRRINRGVRGASAVTEIAPYPDIHPARSSLNAQIAAGEFLRRLRDRPLFLRKSSDRRADERRKRLLPILLDMRDHRERRMEARRKGLNTGTGGKRGIDIYT